MLCCVMGSHTAPLAACHPLQAWCTSLCATFTASASRSWRTWCSARSTSCAPSRHTATLLPASGHTLQVMQNEMDLTKLDLSEVLAPATIMVVSVTATTTKGHVAGR